MRRIFLFFITLVTCHLLPVTNVHAQEEFKVDIVATYDISTSGNTKVSHQVTLTNNFSTIQAASYVFNLEGIKAEGIKAYEDTNKLPFNVTTEGSITTVTVNFPDAVVGKNKARAFAIDYDDPSVATRNGQVWEVTIPKLTGLEKYNSYTSLLKIPNQFGEPAYLSPKPTNIQRGEKLVYSFSAKQLGTAGVVAAFGNFQVFGFELLYHLQNPYEKSGEIEIALPPDNTFQKVYYTRISPKPLSIRLDTEGNWLAKYNLRPKEAIDVKASGAVQLFSSPQENRRNKPIDVAAYLEESKYWQVTDPAIINAARGLKTPKEVYDFVVSTLSYDYNRVKEGVDRLGAREALANPSSAICMEFTDLFIALSRAAGIPAREVNGYAYTENPELQPLSLVADVLHAWPEYWDSEKGIWIPVDPTWGNTTGGLDYFSKLDLSHFAFVFHGTDPEYPLPAGSYKIADNPQKDVSVFFGALPENTQNLQLTVKLDKQFLPFLPFHGALSITNNGSAAMYNTKPIFFSTSGRIVSRDNIEFLPPFTTEKLEFSWTPGAPTAFLSGKNQITVHVGSQEVKYTIGVDFQILQIFGIFLILTVFTAGIIILVFSRRKIKNVFRKTSKITAKVAQLARRLPFFGRKG